MMGVVSALLGTLDNNDFVVCYDGSDGSYKLDFTHQLSGQTAAGNELTASSTS